MKGKINIKVCEYGRIYEEIRKMKRNKRVRKRRNEINIDAILVRASNFKRKRIIYQNRF